MIGYLSGQVFAVDAKSLILMVGGVGYELNFGCDPRTLYQVGQDLAVYTYTNVREDALELYAFQTVRDKTVFNKLRGVTGIGAKSAVTMVASAGAETIIRAVLSKDEKVLLTLPGCGKKTAARILLELEKAFDAEDLPADWSVAPPAQKNEAIDTVADALISLGYQASEIDAIRPHLKAEESDEGALLKQALSLLGKYRS
ncbi:MAG: Holliday junction branch migration protein RuvA [Clostridiales bacterium]|nr:Holliday junction branch migration protein RuvA [Clostridiales bacterium]